MKKQTQNEADIVGLLTKLQEQIAGLEIKVDSLLSQARPQVIAQRPEVKPAAQAHVQPQRQSQSQAQSQPQPQSQAQPRAQGKDRNRGRLMHQATCAQCSVECEIPFKPTGDRPVYCQECYRQRKSGNNTTARPDANLAAKPGIKPVIDEGPISATPDVSVITAEVDIPQTPVKEKRKPAAAVRKPAARKAPVSRAKKPPVRK